MFRPAALVLFLAASASISAAPVIDSIAPATIPAGKSLIVPITATSPNGRPLTYTVTSSTNAIAVVPHSNNPFWKLSVVQAAPANAPGAFTMPFRGGTQTVTNVGDMMFMLFPEYAPRSVDAMLGASAAGFFTSNTIFHRVISGFMIQGGDPLTNGTGGMAFRWDDEYDPEAVFSGSGQLALANAGPDSNRGQFFITVAPFRSGDFGYTLIGQLVRGFNVLSNINNTATNSSSRPLADVIIAQAGAVPDTSDTVLTLVATNRPGVTGTITVMADDGAGGRATNTIAATVITDTDSVSRAFFYGNTATNLVGPVNGTLTNFFNAVDLDGHNLYWSPAWDPAQISDLSGTPYSSILRTLTYNVTNFNGLLQFFVKPATNYVGTAVLDLEVSSSPWLGILDVPYDQQKYTLVFGDTPITAQAAALAPQRPAPFSNLLLATFTNGVAGSVASNFTASINWGDNSITAGTITTNLAGLKEVRGAHTYTNSGDYPVCVTIQSWIGASASVTNTLTVAPTLQVSRRDTDTVIAWPSWAYAYQLQSNTNLASTNWVAVTNLSKLVGFQNVVTNPAPGARTFLRLKKQQP